uniref:Uncharacterized protein n=1 Tax=Mus spicilegus TaxID=10103 RepID=A0A8C6GCH3_MUSSI
MHSVLNCHSYQLPSFSWIYAPQPHTKTKNGFQFQFKSKSLVSMFCGRNPRLGTIMTISKGSIQGTSNKTIGRCPVCTRRNPCKDVTSRKYRKGANRSSLPGETGAHSFKSAFPTMHIRVRKLFSRINNHGSCLKSWSHPTYDMPSSSHSSFSLTMGRQVDRCPSS